MELARVNLKTLLLTMMMFKWGTLCTASSENCLSAPCRNGATCVDTADDYACICPLESVRYTGKNCEQLYDACASAPCRNCTSTPGAADYRCLCPDGFAGDDCTEDLDECRSGPCSEPRSFCINHPYGYFCRCPAGLGGPDCQEPVTDCADDPCENNGTCVWQPNGFGCRCAAGFEGETCERDVDECASEPCRNGAICVDAVAGFRCFCVPGFQGRDCEIDINECASHPCENNATCINEKDRYECECLLGFAGLNCETEVDECESQPCLNGATCQDLSGSYGCICRPGFIGTDCEEDVDECLSGPCLNGGTCRDLEDSYECDCGETGFGGEHCELDIPECASDPCQHGATCLEGLGGYACLCWPGYEGPHCEVDVDECESGPCQNGGTCLQLSDPDLPHRDPDLHPDLHPDPGPWSYAAAAGYVCRCRPGYVGRDCEEDVDECQSGPCGNGGTCKDLVDGWTCSCPAGFLGDRCQDDLDECASQPCQNGGRCRDGPASYSCVCPEAAPLGQPPWGGATCAVPLRGCLDHRCQNGATCLPWLRDDDDVHGHTCVCLPGFHDDQCSTPTTFSLAGAGFLHLHVPIHLHFKTQLRFRTTLPSMLLFFRGDAVSHLLLEIMDGELQAKALSQNYNLVVVLPVPVSDGHWREVQVLLGNEVLILILKGPDCGGDSCRAEDSGGGLESSEEEEGLADIYVGGAPPELLLLSRSREGFTGCMEDLLVDSEAVLPHLMEGAELGCSKTDWCGAAPCGRRGRCVDLWTGFRCDCDRPFHGERCSEEFPAWTYSHEASTSFSSYDVSTNHGPRFHLSFLLTTLKPDGLLLQLRRPPPISRVYLSVFLRSGRLALVAPGNPPLTAPPLLADGRHHLVLLGVEPGGRGVTLEEAGLRYELGGRLLPPEDGAELAVEGADEAYVGGLPEGWDAAEWGGHFKGCLQDLRLDGVRLEVGGRGEEGGGEGGGVYLATDAENVEEGCVSDDTCKIEPCQNGGECAVTFNDFTCTCPPEYVGKTCETRVWCVNEPCADGGLCVDLPDGYECLYNATFRRAPVHYSSGGFPSSVSHVSLELRTRAADGVLLAAGRSSDSVTVALRDSTLRVQIGAALTLRGSRRVSDGAWHRVDVAMATERKRKAAAAAWTVAVDGVADAGSWPERAGAPAFPDHVTLGDGFVGCLGAVRVGGVYLPFREEGDAPPQRARFRITAGGEELRLGCVEDCAAAPCLRGACVDLPGDGGGFECRCEPGFAGERCGEDVDECRGHACLHGGTCIDGENSYSCECPGGFAGPRCQWDFPPIRCRTDVRCLNDGVCRDGPWGANCTCSPGFHGDRCETETNECESDPCQNGGSCLDRFNMFVCECPPGFSGPACQLNKLAYRQAGPWLLVAVPLLGLGLLALLLLLAVTAATARSKRQSEGAYSPSVQELAGARLEMDRMLKVPPEERLI
ncbi:protein crumbs homolog 2-like [Cololabis saira]|uniref:protein crumbs homolog 2-like n=1 Tax=Cololabis saira TaxID=129043 RepID=UPI002AD53A9F|nr:protein crumbs homolog 2-like [Cololabis saira]